MPIAAPTQSRTRALLASLIATAALLAALAAAERSAAAYGDNYGIAPAEGAPALAGHDRAFWVGACDTFAGGTGVTGVGPAPVDRIHCIDAGKGDVASDACPSALCPPEGLGWDRVWEPGLEPSWRLDAVPQAGGHPDLTTMMWMRRSPHHSRLETPQSDGDTKTVIVSLPPGAMANPNAVPKCASIHLTTVPNTCPPESQVGLAEVAIGGHSVSPVNTILSAVYNVEPRRGKTGELLITAQTDPNGLGGNVPITAEARTDGDYGVDAVAMNLPGGVPLLGQTLTIWGVPWAAEHDAYRPPAGYLGHHDPTMTDQRKLQGSIPLGGLKGGIETEMSPPQSQEPQRYDPSWGPIRPYLSNPGECAPGSAPVTRMTLFNWQHPDVPHAYSSTADAPISGCEKAPFDPALSLEVDSTQAESPTAIEVELEVPQNEEAPAGITHNPDDESGAPAYWKSDAGLATSHIKDATVALPEGMTINPAAGNGQDACSPAQIGLTSAPGQAPIRFNNEDPSDDEGAECPDAAKVGVATVETPLLDKEDWPTGEVYLASQYENPFDSLLAVYIVMRSPERGLVAKIAAKVTADPRTGRLSTTIADSPQLPFSRFHMRFKGGPRAPLATPPTCGSPATESTFTPWSAAHGAGGQPVSLSRPITVSSGPGGSPCPAGLAGRPFELGFSAGATNPLAGAHSPFTVRITRPDGAQDITGLQMKAPKGFAAVLRGVPYCSEGQIAAADGRDGTDELASPSCPAASRIGSALVAGGVGPEPLYVGGKLYLAGPYRGAPLSLVVITPAVAGPFDLGTVVVRTALNLNPRTAELTAVSDPLPQILHGIPLKIRDVRVEIDRPNFAINPTNCSEMAVSATVSGSHGASAHLSNRFQVAECERLAFKPALALTLKGGIKRGDNPSLTAELRARPGDANFSRTAVTLPLSAFLDQAHIRTVCTRVQFAAEACPSGSVYGHAEAFSPLLDDPLTGPVYMRSSSHDLPDVVAALKGPAHLPVKVELVGRIDPVKGQGIRTVFDVVPDAPVSRFVLRMQGGNKGLIVNSRNVCRSTNRALVKAEAQNGRRATLRPELRNPKCKRIKRKAAKAKRKAERPSR